MKVIYIIGIKSGTVSKTTGEIATKLCEIYEGETYTVVTTVKIQGVFAYILYERQPNWAYNIKNFIPLSNIDETELIKKREHDTCSV